MDIAVQVSIDDPAEVLQGQVGEGGEHGHGGVVDPDVDAAEAVDGGGGQPFHRLRIGHVGGNGERVSGASPPALLSGGLQRLPAPGRNHDPGALAGKGERGRLPNPAGGAGNHDDKVLELAHMHRLPDAKGWRGTAVARPAWTDRWVDRHSGRKP